MPNIGYANRASPDTRVDPHPSILQKRYHLDSGEYHFRSGFILFPDFLSYEVQIVEHSLDGFPVEFQMEYQPGFDFQLGDAMIIEWLDYGLWKFHRDHSTCVMYSRLEPGTLYETRMA